MKKIILCLMFIILFSTFSFGIFFDKKIFYVVNQAPNVTITNNYTTNLSTYWNASVIISKNYQNNTQVNLTITARLTSYYNITSYWSNATNSFYQKSYIDNVTEVCRYMQWSLWENYTGINGSVNYTYPSLPVFTNGKEENNYTHLQINTSQSPYDSLILYMPFDVNNGSDSITRDYSQYNNHGLVNSNVTWLSNKGYNQQGVYNFSGISNCIAIADSSTLTSNTISISVWFKISGNTPSYQSIVMKHNTSGGEWGIGTNGTNLRNWYRNNSGAGVQYTNTSFSLTPYYNSWTHLIVIFNGSHIINFINNVSITSYLPPQGLNISFDTTSNLILGSYSSTGLDCGSSASFQLNGTIDEVMIFNKSLTTGEINLIYTNQSKRFQNVNTITRQTFNISQGAKDINLSMPGIQNNMNTIIETKMGYWDKSYGYNDTDTSLIGHWALDGNALDYSQYNNHGNVTGAIVTPNGKIDSAYSFDGSTSKYITIGKNMTTNNSEGISISAWIKQNSNSPSTQSIVTFNNFYGMGFLNNEIRAVFQVNGTARSSYSTTANLESGLWTHIVIKYKPNEDDKLKIFINGVEETAYNTPYNMTGKNIDSPQTISFIGKRTDYGYNGTIDEVRIWNRSLSADEVKEQYEIGSKVINIRYTPPKNITSTAAVTFTKPIIASYIKFDSKLISNQYNFYTPIYTGMINVSFSIYNGTNIDLIEFKRNGTYAKVKAMDFITASYVYDKSLGKAIDLIKDSDAYRDKNGILIDSKHYAYEEQENGLSIEKRIATLEQSIVELKEEIEKLKKVK